jgi:hypothetical protein
MPSPDRTPSTMFSFAMTATSSPTASRTARTTWRANRARFSRVPPHRSLRRLRFGLRKELSR